MMKLRKVLLLALLTGCSGMEISEQENLRRHNAKGEFVLRNGSERHFPLETPRHRIRKPYPWEREKQNKKNN